jgi:hypothetical protein
MPFPSFCFVGALYVAWVFFTWVYFLLEPFFSVACTCGAPEGGFPACQGAQLGAFAIPTQKYQNTVVKCNI